MTLLQLRRQFADANTHAKIISDGCRDYVVSGLPCRSESDREASKEELLQDWRGEVLRFPSLASAKRRLQKANVDSMELCVRIAADEACAGVSLQDSGFTSVKI